MNLLEIDSQGTTIDEIVGVDLEQNGGTDEIIEIILETADGNQQSVWTKPTS